MASQLRVSLGFLEDLPQYSLVSRKKRGRGRGKEPLAPYPVRLETNLSKTATSLVVGDPINFLKSLEKLFLWGTFLLTF